MRLLQIMTSRAHGGAETYALDTILSLHERGVDQCVVMHKDASRFGELKAAGIRLSPEALRFPLRAMQKHAIGRLIASEKPRFVQSWMRRAASIVPKTDIPVIGWFGGYYDPRHFTSCQHLVGVTRDIAAHMVRNGVPPQNAHYIPTFPVIEPMEPVSRASLDTPQDAKVLLTLSRLHQKKGLDTFLNALQTLPECYAWIAGDGPLQAELEALAKTLGVSERVRFLGWRTDRSALLQSADICVLPSRYEPFGTVILEAWAAQTPLVACASAGPAAHVEDGKTGLLTPIDDAGALASAIRRVLIDAALRDAIARAGYAAYQRNFTRAAVTSRWLSFYDGIAYSSALKTA